MDNNRFDHLSRAFAPPSRRKLLRLLTGTVFAGSSIISEWQETVARFRKSRRCPEPIGCCPKGTRCLNETCFTRGTCPGNTDNTCTHSAGCGVDCFCGVTTEGQIVCHQNTGFCTNPIPCTSTSACFP